MCNCLGDRCRLTADDARHGRRTGYAKHGCRCDPCTDAQADYMADYQPARRVQRAAIDARSYARRKANRLLTSA